MAWSNWWYSLHARKTRTPRRSLLQEPFYFPAPRPYCTSSLRCYTTPIFSVQACRLIPRRVVSRALFCFCGHPAVLATAEDCPRPITQYEWADLMPRIWGRWVRTYCVNVQTCLQRDSASSVFELRPSRSLKLPSCTHGLDRNILSWIIITLKFAHYARHHLAQFN